MNSLSNDYISVGIPIGSNENIQEFRKSKSIRRVWNQLSRFQRSLIYMCVAILFFTMFYFIPSNVVNYVDSESSILNKNVLNEPEHIKREDNADVQMNVLEEPDNGQFEPKKDLQAATSADLPKQFPGPTNSRQTAVVEAFKHAWKGYKKFAWGHDNLKPISETYYDWFGLGLTIVDSLDTLYIMNLQEEYGEARDWVANHLTFDNNRDVNLFEVTIRVLGGLLAIYHLSGDKMFLNKAVDLGDRLLPSFDTTSGIPFSDINLKTRNSHPPKWSPDSSTAEITTLQLEFRDLSRSSGNPKYERAAWRVSRYVHTLEKKDGLVPIYINPNTGQFRSYATITLGARGDSYYEYLLKQWIQTGKTINFLRDDYALAIDGVEKHLVRKTVPNGFVFIGELLVGGKDFKPKMDHLTCFMPGTLALGVHVGLPMKHQKLAEDLLTTCYQTYVQQPTFLAPEITYFSIQGENSNDMYVKSNDAHNLLRPEFLESLWYMYQLSGNLTYQDWGWNIFQAFDKYTKVPNGYTSIGNVKNVSSLRPRDMMESFFLGETLKYLFLLFSDDRKIIDLDKYVFNSEAHPLPVYTS